jgi:hypothetical protein
MNDERNNVLGIGAGIPVPGDNTTLLRRAPVDVPMNLADWVDTKKLAEWIHQEIAALDRSKPEIAEFFRRPPEARPDLLLAILVYAYATQVFLSDEIIRACHLDPVLNELCDSTPPFRQEIDHFRRKGRPVLEHVLGKVLVRAVKERFNTSGSLPPGLEYSLLHRAADRVQTARHMETWNE